MYYFLRTDRQTGAEGTSWGFCSEYWEGVLSPLGFWEGVFNFNSCEFRGALNTFRGWYGELSPAYRGRLSVYGELSPL